MCIVCGHLAPTSVTRTFRPVGPLALIGLAVLCFPIGIVAGLILTWRWRATATVPVCAAHTSHWAIRNQAVAVTVGLFGLGYGSLWVFAAIVDDDWRDTLVKLAMWGMAVLWLLVLIAASWQTTGVHADRIGARLVRFRVVHPVFVAALAEERRQRGIVDVRDEPYGDQRDDFDDEAMERRPISCPPGSP